VGEQKDRGVLGDKEAQRQEEEKSAEKIMIRAEKFFRGHGGFGYFPCPRQHLHTAKNDFPVPSPLPSPNPPSQFRRVATVRPSISFQYPSHRIIPERRLYKLTGFFRFGIELFIHQKALNRSKSLIGEQGDTHEA
jgi:hypothetical protein